MGGTLTDHSNFIVSNIKDTIWQENVKMSTFLFLLVSTFLLLSTCFVFLLVSTIFFLLLSFYFSIAVYKLIL